MPSAAFHGTPSYQRIGSMPVKPLLRWVPSLAIWGIGAGIYATYFLSMTPVVKNGLLLKIPVLKNYYEDKIPPEDKPF